MTALAAGLLIAGFSPNPGAQLFGVLLALLGLGYLLLKRFEGKRAEKPLAAVWYVVVNASASARHDVAWCDTRKYADGLADDMQLVHGWQYVVEEHTGGEDCATCRKQRTGGSALCYSTRVIA